MLSKDKRLNLKKDYHWVVTGKKLETKYLKLFIREGNNQVPKIGVAVSSEVFKKAIQRNRAKRLSFVAFESLYPLLPSHSNIMALPKADILDVKSQDVILDLEEKLKYEKIIS